MGFRVGGAGSEVECPKCRFTMVRLQGSSIVNRNEGYLLDTTTQLDWYGGGCLFGFDEMLLGMFVYYVLTPIGSKLFGDRVQRHYRRIVHRYPRAMICPNCRYLVREP
jgi:hypothetical protein